MEAIEDDSVMTTKEKKNEMQFGLQKIYIMLIDSRTILKYTPNARCFKKLTAAID